MEELNRLWCWHIVSGFIIINERRCKPKSSQEAYGDLGITAEIQSSGGIICWQEKYPLCTPQICILRKSGKEKKKNTTYEKFALLFAAFYVGTQQTHDAKSLWSDEAKINILSLFAKCYMWQKTNTLSTVSIMKQGGGCISVGMLRGVVVDSAGRNVLALHKSSRNKAHSCFRMVQSKSFINFLDCVQRYSLSNLSELKLFWKWKLAKKRINLCL